MKNKIKQLQEEVKQLQKAMEAQGKIIESLREGNEMQLDFNDKIFYILKGIENNESR